MARVTASRFIERVLGRVRTVSIAPLAAGRLVPQLGNGLRCHPVGSYNVYLRYDAAPDTLYVVRVLHGRRNLTGQFIKE